MTALMGMAVDGGTGDGGDATGEAPAIDPLQWKWAFRGGKSGDENDPGAAAGQGAETRTRLAQAVSSTRTAATSTAT